jgi:hypothetical protein
MCRRIAPLGAAVAAAGMALAVGGGPASAQTTAWLPPPELNAYEMPARELAPRPRMSLGIGMGSTFDAVGFPDGTHAIPAFFATGGAGDGLFGVDFGAFSSSASGRDRAQQADPVDRQALDLFGVIRPAAKLRPGDRRYRMRVLRTLAGELGLGLEREGTSTRASSRFRLHTGARVELPLTPVTLSREHSELRLRLAVSRGIGLYTPTIRLRSGEVVEVGDTAAELYAGLVVVF